MTYDTMKSPVFIGQVKIANRVVMPAMGVNLSSPAGGVSDDIIAFYEARARGGVGLIISEITRISDGEGIGEPCQLAARGIGDIPDLQRLMDAIHKYPTKLFIQLQHPGIMASPALIGRQAVSASSIEGWPGSPGRCLETNECESLVEAFIRGAEVARQAGADGVELHAAHGYLINQFLSPAFNLRTDKWGGDFEGRMRFVTEIIKGIKNRCDQSFPISVRINAEEAIPNGIRLEESARIAIALEDAGADAINVSCYSKGCIDPGSYPQGWKKYMAEAIKKVVSIPVISVCNIKEPEIGEQLLQEGVCDLIGVGRGHLADPEWCKKSFEGRKEEIRLCIGCMTCFEEICKPHRVKCAVNPVTGREREYSAPQKNGEGRKVVVVGGGPAGIEAALVLKERNFKPVIFEEKKRLGGALNIADKGYGKMIMTKYTDSLITQIKKAGIEVRYDEVATVEKIKALDPCGIFVACGGHPVKPPIPGIDHDHVCTAEEVLLGQTKPKGSVAVIGSGMTGLEASEILASSGCHLTIVEMVESLGPGMYPPLVENLMERIMPHSPKIFTMHRLEQIDDSGITIKNLPEKEPLFLPVDWVVLAVGGQPRAEVVDNIRSSFSNVRIIGDAVKCGRILEATQDAHAKAFVFEPL